MKKEGQDQTAEELASFAMALDNEHRGDVAAAKAFREFGDFMIGDEVIVTELENGKKIIHEGNIIAFYGYPDSINPTTLTAAIHTNQDSGGGYSQISVSIRDLKSGSLIMTRKTAGI